MKKIIVVTGLPGSGKSEVSEEIKKSRIPTVYTGDIIREEVAKRGLELSVESSEYTARELRKRYGPEAPTRLVEHKIDSMKTRILCIDGPRSIKEVEYLKLFGEVYLIIVESARKVRYSRLMKRGKPTDPEGWEHFLWSDRKELERGMKTLSGTKKFTKFVIKNTGTMPDLNAKVAKILREIRADPIKHVSKPRKSRKPSKPGNPKGSRTPGKSKKPRKPGKNR